MNRALADNIKMAFQALRRNKLRAVLSVLGMSIGIMSIVIIMSAGNSLKGIFEDQVAAFGSDFIEVEIKVPNTNHTSADNAGGLAQGISITTLTLEDKEAVDKLPNIKHSYGGVMGQGAAITPYREHSMMYFAVTYEFEKIDTAGIAKGRFFTQEEDRNLARVIVLGSKAAEQYFPNQDPVGQHIRIGKTNFKVVGVMNERGSSGFMNMDEFTFIPLRTAHKLLLGFDHLLMIMAQPVDVSLSRQTAEEMRLLMRERHEITDPNKDDFAVITQEEGLQIVNTLLSGITLVLTIIASIALVVGGVGIMNIMYVAVNERIFEIGLRKSLGATMGAIKSQFLIEAIIVTLMGACFGIVIAVILIYLMYLIANASGFGWPLAYSVQSIIISLVFASGIGLIFGWFPAKRASELKPVEALSRKLG